MKKLYTLLFFFVLNNLLFAQTFQWATSVTGTNDEYTHSIGLDGVGNIYAQGFSNSSVVNFDSVSFIGPLNFIAKYSPSGNLIWKSKIRGASCIAVDNSGNSFIAGSTHDTLICKYDSSGSLLWANSLALANGVISNSICLDDSNNIYVGGTFANNMIVGKDTLVNNGGFNIFVIKCDSLGKFIWAKSFGGTTSDDCIGICTDKFYNVFITGYFDSPNINFGSTTLTNRGADDIYVAKLNNNGICQWVTQEGGIYGDYSSSICTDLDGNVFITGWYITSTTFDTITIGGGASSNFYIAKYDGTGKLAWLKWANGNGTMGNSLKADNSGNVYVTGTYFATTVFGSFSLTALAGHNIFVCKYDANGQIIWAKSAGGAGGGLDDEGMTIALDNSGSVYVGGFYSSSIAYFDTLSLINYGRDDMFIAKLSQPTTVSINEMKNESNILIYPNPNNGRFQLAIYQKNRTRIKIAVEDVYGKVVFAKEYQSNGIDFNAEIALTPFARGIYFVQALFDNHVINRKIVIE